MITGLACAKVNLSLRVGGSRPDGYHQLHGLFQSISWHDKLAVDFADEDHIAGPDGGLVPDGDDNLVMAALRAVREAAGSSRAVTVELAKAIPVAAGLGGGSADAAAALALGGRLFGVEKDGLADLAPRLGSDVPFCFRGGTAMVRGRGDLVEAVDFAGHYSLAVVVPPVELSTPAVYSAWDTLDAPRGPAVDGARLPPSLRGMGPLANDLYPAAVAQAPMVDEWRHELSVRWGRPVVMSGSGPSLFGFFVDDGEAEDALSDIPGGARAAVAARPVPFGWVLHDGTSTVDATGRRWDERDDEMRQLLGID